MLPASFVGPDLWLGAVAFNRMLRGIRVRIDLAKTVSVLAPTPGVDRRGAIIQITFL